ncbi:MAG: hypothetical protein V3W41_07785 [Planctomycetota bacterium]
MADFEVCLILVDPVIGELARKRLLGLREGLQERGYKVELIESLESDREGAFGAWDLVRRIPKPLRDSATILHLAGPRARLAALLSCSLRKKLVIEEARVEGPTRGWGGILERSLASRASRRLTLLAAPEKERSSRRVHRELRVGPGLLDLNDESETAGGSDPSSPAANASFRIGLFLEPRSSDRLRRMLGAFRVLAASSDSLRVVLQGGPSDWNLAPWVADLGLTKKQEFSGFSEPTPDCLAALQLAWIPGIQETDVRTTASCFAAGLPVVCDFRSPWAEGIKTIGGALMRDADWPMQFAEAARELLKDDALLSAIQTAGPILARREAGLEPYVDRVDAAYRRLALEGQSHTDAAS